MGLDIFFHEGQPHANKRSLSAQRKVGGERPSGCIAKNAALIGLSSWLVRRFSGMSDHVYKKLELVGSSQSSIEDAVQNAISLAAKTIRNLRWFEVIETRGQIEDNKINHWQVTIKAGFTLDR
jgi:hypothetical protein